jgi:protein phosphatase
MDERMVECSVCHAHVSKDRKNCPHCGTEISFKACSACNASIPLDAERCPHCGREISAKASLKKASSTASA